MPSSLDELRAWLVESYDGGVDHGRLDVIAAELAAVAHGQGHGEIVELGCYRGGMALWIRAQLDALGLADRIVHVFDSFLGMPTPGRHDSGHIREGEFACGVEEVLAVHRAWGLRSPVIHPGWFAATLPSQMPGLVAFAHVDCGFYESVLTSLTYCVPRLTPAAMLVVADYAAEEDRDPGNCCFPGVRRACDDFFGAAASLHAAGSKAAYGVYRKPD